MASWPKLSPNQLGLMKAPNTNLGGGNHQDFLNKLAKFIGKPKSDDAIQWSLLDIDPKDGKPKEGQLDAFLEKFASAPGQKPEAEIDPNAVADAGGVGAAVAATATGSTGAARQKQKIAVKKMTPWARAGAITKKIGAMEIGAIQNSLKAYFGPKSRTWGTLQEQNEPDGKWGKETYEAVMAFQKDIKKLIKQGKLNSKNLTLPSGKKLEQFQADGIFGKDTMAVVEAMEMYGLWDIGTRINLSAEPKPVAKAAAGSDKKPTADVAKTGAKTMTIEAAMPKYAELKWLKPMKKAINDEWNENQTWPSREQAAEMEQLAKYLITIMGNTEIEIPQGAKVEEIVIKETKLIFNTTIKDPKFKKGLEGPSALDEFLKEMQGLAQESVKESKAYAYLEKLINEELDKLLG